MSDKELIVRLLIAAALGSLIGAERERLVWTGSRSARRALYRSGHGDRGHPGHSASIKPLEAWLGERNQTHQIRIRATTGKSRSNRSIRRWVMGRARRITRYVCQHAEDVEFDDIV